MEILDAFDMSDVKAGLVKFKHWLEGFDLPEQVKTLTGIRSNYTEFHEKHKSARMRWITPAGFPAEYVIQAYMNPVVENAQERFTWGQLDMENLVLFAGRYMGWSAEDTNRALGPVVERLQSGYTQTRIESYMMKYEDSIKFADVRSKRLRTVLRSAKRGKEEIKREEADNSDSAV